MPKIPTIGFASSDWSRSISTPEGPVPGGSNWIRLQQSRPYMKYRSTTGLLVHDRRQGFGVLDWFGKTHYNLDVIVIQRLMFEDLVDKMEDRKKFGQVIINDIDDWYWGLHKDNHAYRLTHPDNNKDENIAHYKNIIQQSDAVVASTPFLQQKMSEDFGCENVHLVHNCVKVSDFTKRYMRNRKPVVGWVGSTSHRSGDLEILDGVLDNQKFRVHHSGHVDGTAWFADKVGLDRQKVSKTPMHHPQQYARLSFQFDIGIAPLNDVPFNHAKSWIKAIEYAAAGVPFVASNLGEYARLKEVYGIGRLASNQDEWNEHILELTNYSVRNQEAKKQLDLVKRELDVRVMAQNWDSVLENYM